MNMPASKGKKPTTAFEAKSETNTEGKAPLAIRPPMTAREAQLSSVFDSCIPGNMLMYPIQQPPSNSSQ